MDQQDPARAKNDTAPPPAPPPASPASRQGGGEPHGMDAPAPRRRGGFFGRLLAALLVIIITSFVALAAVVAGLLYLGFTPTMPQELAAARVQLGTAQAQNGLLQTQVAAQAQRGATDHEILGELQLRSDDLDTLQRELRQEREASLRQNATLVAEANASRDAVALFATAEAGRAALLARLDQRSARIERFLQRLGDIAGDAASDLDGIPTDGATAPLATPTTISPASPTPAPSPTAAPAATAVATGTPVATPSPTLRLTPRTTPTATR